MSQEYIEIKGARVNNLKNIDVRIPRNKFVVISGVSGSGKSSLAFDTTEIYEYLRLLFARIGRTYSPISGEEVKKHSTEDVVQKMLEFSEGTKFVVMAPIKVPEGRTLEQQLKACILQGYSRMTSPGTPDGEQFIRIDDYLESNPESEPAEMPYLVIDRLSSSDNKETISRLVDSAETAFFEGHGEMRLMVLPSGLSYDFSTRFEADGITFEEPTDQLFSFNSPAGACPECQGFGKVMGIDEHLVIPDTGLSVYDGCVVCWHGEKMGEWKNWFIRHAANDDFPIFEPYYNLTQQQKDWLWHGLPSDRGAKEKPCIDAFFQMVKENQYKIQYRVMLARYRGKTTCPTCHGTRLKPEAEYVKINGRSITDLVQMPVIRLKDWFAQLQLPEHDAEVGKRLLLEITSRLQFLLDVGLGYLTLNRLSNSLSGGESQRINLCTSLGSSLVGSLYILDEPSIGLHSRDTDRLIHVLKELQALGNTVVVVEHDEEIIRAADYIIDIGPDAGRLGGEVVYAGDPSTTSATIKTSKPSTPSRSYTLQYLSGEETIPVPASRRPWNRHIDIKGARMNNLRGINVEIPLNVLTVVTGVSGSGKSSLIKGILYPALKRHMGDVCDAPGEYSGLAGDLDAIRRVEFVDQNPIGKSSRSNPATYVKAYDAIRDLYADQPLSQQMGFTPQYFSFNADGGRCDECKGAGTITVEMQFMADLVLECEACHGKRFKHDILDVKYEGKNIDDILNMTITEAIEFFKANGQKTIVNRLKPLEDVGLGYIKLGQNSSTLSGGENQRVKLAYFIGQEKQEPTLFIFDEPTTGLHFHDIKRLMSSLDALIARGHTVLIIEHNMDVIKLADHVIDLGPDGGDKGGNLVIAGTPEEVAKCKNSITGQYLKLKI